jgi:hypothetical protein
MSAPEKERSFQEIWQLFEETDRRFKETEKGFKDTKERFRDLEEQFKETDRRLEKRSQQVWAQIEETNAKVAALTSKWGRFVEGLVVPAAMQLFAERGISVNRVSQRVRVRKNGTGMEIDVLAVNGEYAVLIEVKSTLGVDDIRNHIERIGKFKEFFPEYSDRKVVGAVAGIVIDEDADKFAYKQGLFVIAQSGETVHILNDAQFQPKYW